MLYWRRGGSDVYESVADRDDEVGFSNPVSCSEAPIVIFEAWRSRGAGYDWDSIRKLNVISGEVTVLVDRASFPVEAGSVRNWPSNLLSAKPSGEAVICAVGFEKELRGNSSKVSYHVCALTFSPVSIVKLRELKNVFF